MEQKKPTRKQRLAGRAQTRYLSEFGFILKGVEIFQQTQLVMPIDPATLRTLRAFTIEQRRKRFDKKKAWNPSGVGTLATELPTLPALDEEKLES